MLPRILDIAFVFVFAAFISVQIVVVLAGQRRQRSQIKNLNQNVKELNNRLKSPDERSADAAKRKEIEEHNRKVREFYEYGGC